MPRIIMAARVVAVLTIAALAGGAVLWLRERRRHAAFPASDAAALLNPARRWIQPPEHVVRSFGIRAGDIVLELGPGPGYFTAEAASAVGPRGRLLAIDLQREMLVALRERIPATATVSIAVADAMHLPLRTAALDGAFLVSMLGEVPDPAAALREVARALRPGGTVSFSETFNDPDYVRLAVLRRMCSDAGLTSRDWRRQLLGYVARFVRLPNGPTSASERPPGKHEK